MCLLFSAGILEARSGAGSARSSQSEGTTAPASNAVSEHLLQRLVRATYITVINLLVSPR